MEHIKKDEPTRTPYGDRMRELMKGYDGNLELIERGERLAEQIKEQQFLGGFSISFQSKPAGAEKQGAEEPCNQDRP